MVMLSRMSKCRPPHPPWVTLSHDWHMSSGFEILDSAVILVRFSRNSVLNPGATVPFRLVRLSMNVDLGVEGDGGRHPALACLPTRMWISILISNRIDITSGIEDRHIPMNRYPLGQLILESPLRGGLCCGSWESMIPVLRHIRFLQPQTYAFLLWWIEPSSSEVNVLSRQSGSPSGPLVSL